MSAPVPRTVADLDAPAEALWAERDRRVAALQERQFEELRLSLPLDDLDRHALDTVADAAFARLAPGYPAGGVA